REVTGDVDRERLPLVGALVRDGGCGRAAVADREVEALADGLAVGIGRRDGDRVAAVVAVGRGAGDDAGVRIDGEAAWQRGRERQGIARGRCREVAGDLELEFL